VENLVFREGSKSEQQALDRTAIQEKAMEAQHFYSVSDCLQLSTVRGYPIAQDPGGAEAGTNG
jgi:hypothetical protein